MIKLLRQREGQESRRRDDIENVLHYQRNIGKNTRDVDTTHRTRRIKDQKKACKD